MSDTDRVVGEILAGGHDGNVLKIIEAVQTRMAQGSTQTYWRIRYDGFEVTEQSITAGEMRTVCDLLTAARGQRVWMGDVHPEMEPGDFIAVLSTALQTRQGLSLNDAVKRCEAIPMQQLRESVDLFEVSPAPKD